MFDRFWEKVAIKGPDDCWEWLACRNNSGYGAFRNLGATWMAHRLAWTLERGPIPDDMCLCHRCDNRGCVNPNHLFLGTRADNMQDAATKGRMSPGEKHWRHKVSAKDVGEIRVRHAAGECTQRELGALYGVSETQIRNIVYRKQWTSI